VTLREALRLIVITDEALAAPRSVVDVVGEALKGGARAIQLRDKRASGRELLDQARVLRALTREFGAILFINDRFDVALAADADGVHVGPNDLPVAAVRREAADGFLIGTSTDDPRRARRLEAEGADYIGCGTVFPTSTKKDAGTAIGISGLKRVVEAVDIPVVGIGGITEDSARGVFAGSGAAGIATVGAIMAADDPRSVVENLLLADFRESADQS
jgi:thiamine-phosphate diphosphorylase